ncbi:hypothetical protein [Streptomyces sp. DW26H14]|uniref:hypothetical protein n=1 Tax=Streptomyces sp. DW26H14 TaxID=3435395 RepID=UPI00403D9785
MRPRRAAALSLAVAAALVSLAGGPAGAGEAPSSRAPACGNPAAHTFPVRTGLRGGPGTYEAGGGARTWHVDLTNTTAHACRDVHPLIVVTDSGRRLKADQVALRLADSHGTLRAMPLHTSDEDEIIAVPDEDTAGFTLPAHGTLSLDASLAFAAGAPSGAVTVSAAAVQREGGDGDWIGESEPYRFTVVGGGAGPAVPDGGADPAVPQLAATGAAGVLARTALSVALVAAGAGLVVLVERRRTRRT